MTPQFDFTVDIKPRLGMTGLAFPRDECAMINVKSAYAGKTSKSVSMQIQIRVNEPVMKQAGINIGDMVIARMSACGKAMQVEKASAGYKVVPYGDNSPETSQALKGKPSKSTIKMTIPPEEHRRVKAAKVNGDIDVYDVIEIHKGDKDSKGSFIIDTTLLLNKK